MLIMGQIVRNATSYPENFVFCWWNKYIQNQRDLNIYILGTSVISRYMVQTMVWLVQLCRFEKITMFISKYCYFWPVFLQKIFFLQKMLFFRLHSWFYSGPINKITDFWLKLNISKR